MWWKLERVFFEGLFILFFRCGVCFLFYNLFGMMKFGCNKQNRRMSWTMRSSWRRVFCVEQLFKRRRRDWEVQSRSQQDFRNSKRRHSETRKRFQLKRYFGGAWYFFLLKTGTIYFFVATRASKNIPSTCTPSNQNNVHSTFHHHRTLRRHRHCFHAKVGHVLRFEIRSD